MHEHNDHRYPGLINTYICSFEHNKGIGKACQRKERAQNYQLSEGRRHDTADFVPFNPLRVFCFRDIVFDADQYQ